MTSSVLLRSGPDRIRTCGQFTPGTALSQSFALSPGKIRYNVLELVNAYPTSKH